MYTSVVNAQAKAEKRAEFNAYVQAFIDSGATITICSNHTVKPKTFRSPFGAWGRGAKACTLRNSGVAKGRG